VSIGGTAIAGGIWFYKNYVKAPPAQKRKTLLQQTIDEIQYLATAAEIKTLKKLNSDDDVHAFMAAFWQKQDPSPGTDENEFQEAYLRRWREANTLFRNGAQEGWKTDRGRVYILYGPPEEIDHLPWTGFALSKGGLGSIKAMEAWLYLRPASGFKGRDIFSNYNSGMAKFIFADFQGTGLYKQIYSSEQGEFSDSRVFVIPQTSVENSSADK
jgi:GWxTD domain-containing protein